MALRWYLKDMLGKFFLSLLADSNSLAQLFRQLPKFLRLRAAGIASEIRD